MHGNIKRCLTGACKKVDKTCTKLVYNMNKEIKSRKHPQKSGKAATNNYTLMEYGSCREIVMS